MTRCIFLINALSLLFLSTALPAASIAILMQQEKEGALSEGPLAGFKAIAGPDVAQFEITDPGAAQAICAKIKASGAKVVFTIGKDATKAAMQELPGMPIVYCMVMSPQEDGIGGGSVTGVTLDIPMVKQFTSFKAVVPNLKKIGIVYSDETSGIIAKEMKAAAVKTGVTVIEKKVASDKDVPNAIRELKGKIDGLYLPPDRTVANRDAFQFIALFTFENNLPFMAPAGRFVKKGALVALMIDFEELGKQAAAMAKKIVGGASPSSIPVEPPQATILVLNQKTAQTIGINIPPSLLETSQIIK